MLSAMYQHPIALHLIGGKAISIYVASYTAKLNKSTHKNLEMFLEQQKVLWNIGLEYCIMKYKHNGSSTSFYDLCKELTGLRELEEFNQFDAIAQRTIIQKLHKSFQSFFRRLKQKQKPGYPRFKGKNRQVKSFETGQFKIKQQGKYNSINIKGIGKFRFKGNVDGKVKLIRIVKTPIRIKIQLVQEIDKRIESKYKEPLGIDMGVKSRMVLSNGFEVEKQSRNLKKIKQLQVKFSRCTKRSNNRRKLKTRLAKEWQRINEREHGKLHEITTDLVKSQSNKFVLEDLDIQNMMKWKNLNRVILEQTWNKFTTILTYKAENAGGWVKVIDPKNTTQRCSSCGNIPEKKIELNVRTYECDVCGFIEDRDVNAARNILSKGISGWEMPLKVPGRLMVA